MFSLTPSLLRLPIARAIQDNYFPDRSVLKNTNFFFLSDTGANKKEDTLIGGIAGASGICLIAVIALGVMFVKYRIARRLMNRNKVGDLYTTQEEEMRRRNAYIKDDDETKKDDSL